MADWKVIDAVSRTLRAVLLRHPSLSEWTFDVRVASSAVFAELSSNISRPTVTLFLYRVVENPELRNAPPRVLADGSSSRQPLALELCYLVTPWSAQRGDNPTLDVEEAAVADEQRLLGIVLQSFDEHGEVGEPLLWRTELEPNWHPEDGLQLSLESLPIEDLYRIWDNSEVSYRSSLTYRVRVVGIDPLGRSEATRVREAELAAGER